MPITGKVEEASEKSKGDKIQILDETGSQNKLKRPTDLQVVDKNVA